MKTWKLKMSMVTLAFLVFCSFCFHVTFHKEHFQEIDSDMVYHALNHFDEFAYQYTKFSYQKGSANELHKQYRRYLIEIVNALNLPEWFKGFFVIPYSTTYSPVPGLIYSAMHSYFKDYNSFMSAGIILMQIIFHLSVILLFFILRGIGISARIAWITSVIYLFSVSHYSYAYNLGSPLWTVVSSMLWLAILVFSKTENYEKNVSWGTSILIFFNYLIVVYWLGYLLLRIKQEKKIFQILKKQALAIFFVVLCAVIFVQPGQGGRGVSVSIFEMHEELKYILVNFSAWFTSEKLFLIQLLLTVFPLAALFYFLMIKKKQKASFYLQLSTAVLIVYSIFVAFDVLPFLASRHMLFLGPIFFIFFAEGSESILQYFHKTNFHLKATNTISVILLIIAPYALWLRKSEVRDFLKIESNINLPHLILLDSRFEFPYNQQNTLISVPAFGIGVTNFYDLKPGQKYTYLSQWLSLEDFISVSEKYRRQRKTLLPNPKLHRNAKIFRQDSFCDLKVFMAYERFRYGFQKSNCRYFYEFEVTDGKQTITSN